MKEKSGGKAGAGLEHAPALIRFAEQLDRNPTDPCGAPPGRLVGESGQSFFPAKGPHEETERPWGSDRKKLGPPRCVRLRRDETSGRETRDEISFAVRGKR